MTWCPTQRLGARGDCVTFLQKWLNAYRKKKEQIAEDGVFGVKTRSAVRAFQKEYGLEVDGVVGRYTWDELARHGGDVHLPLRDHEHETPTIRAEIGLCCFVGNADWIHEWEGHAGKAYWPGGSSGVTLDPGFDLAHANAKLIEEVWEPRLTFEQMVEVRNARPHKGLDAKRYLARARFLKTIRVSRSEAKDIFPVILSPYWKKITKRFPDLLNDFEGPVGHELQAATQTAFLSLAFNRGAGNPALRVLGAPLKAHRYSVLGNTIAAMQQDHRLPGIRRRRRAEGQLILDLL